MADNVNVKNESGVSARPIATDEIAGAHHQQVKIEWGPDGTANAIDDVAGKRLPVGGAVLGLPDDAAATTDSASTGFISLFKRLLTQLALLVNNDTAALCPGAAVAAGAIFAPTAKLRLVGFACKETSGSAGAGFTYYHGTSTGGVILCRVTLASNESCREFFGKGLDISGGLYLGVDSGAISVSPYVRTA